MLHNNKIVFIGGIHGAGKGKLCKEISNKYKLKHYSASELIKWSEISSNENKKVDDISFTQKRLLNGLVNIPKNENVIILDGHFCLLNKNNKPEIVDESVFVSINPIALSIVIEDIEIILSRLNNRDKIKYDLLLLEKMQNLELKYAEFLSSKLDIPLVRIYNQKYNSLIKYLT